MFDPATDAPETVEAPSAPRGRSCANCGSSFQPVRDLQQFCSPTCKKTFHARAATEGGSVIALLKAWRASRNNKADAALGSACLSEICAIVDLLNSRDREAGRPSPQAYAKRLLKSGRYIDRNWADRNK